MIVKTTRPCWLFSTNVSESELSSAFLSRAKFFSVTQMSSILNESAFSIRICTSDDYLHVKSRLSQLFDGADSLMLDELVGLLSRPIIDEDFFDDSWNPRRWSLNASPDDREYFHRYVTLLALAVDSAPWPNNGWPHGRISLPSFDGNYSGKFLESVLQQVRRADREEPNFSPFGARLVVEDVIEFIVVLARFADNINDELWSSALSVVRQMKMSVDFVPFCQRLNVGLGNALTTYFATRGLTTHEGRTYSDIEPTTDRGTYRSHVADGSQFWMCLNEAITQSIPDWAATCSAAGAQLIGLVLAAIDGDPFAKCFVSSDRGDFGLPLVECSFGQWSDAFRLGIEEILEAFHDAEMCLSRLDRPYDRRFYFNT